MQPRFASCFPSSKVRMKLGTKQGNWPLPKPDGTDAEEATVSEGIGYDEDDDEPGPLDEVDE